MMILRCMACILQMVGYELLVALVMQWSRVATMAVQLAMVALYKLWRWQ